jgi:tetratricopeptide (TPR) repeat protein
MRLSLLVLILVAAQGADSFEDLLREGLLALHRSELPAARARLERASKLKPGDARVWLGLAQTYRKSGDPKRAAPAAERTARLGPADPVILHGLAIYYSESGEWAKAAAFEARYAERAPRDTDAPARAAAFYLQAGQAKSAIELAQKALAADNRAAWRALLAKAYVADSRLDLARVELEHAVKLSPYEEAHHFDLAHLLLVRQEFQAAVQALEAARKIFDKSAQIELALGVAYYGQRRFSDAVDAFLRAATLAPEVEQPYVFLGRILNHAEAKLAEVTEKFAAYAAADPRSHYGYFLHAKALAAQGAVEQAEPLLRKSIALHDRFWESHFELGLLLERRREFAAAATALERSIQLNPKNPSPHYRLARIYDRLGRPDDARLQRELHEKLSAEETAALRKRAGGMERLENVVK